MAAHKPAAKFSERLADAAARSRHDLVRGKIVEFVRRGDFGLASGQKPDGTYERVWFQEPVTADEVAFESGVFLDDLGITDQVQIRDA